MLGSCSYIMESKVDNFTLLYWDYFAIYTDQYRVLAKIENETALKIKSRGLNFK